MCEGVNVHGLPLIQGVGFESVHAIDVRDVEERLVAGRVGRHFHQDLVEKQWLERKMMT